MFRKLSNTDCKELGIRKPWFYDMYFEKIGIRYNRYCLRTQLNWMGRIVVVILLPIVFLSHLWRNLVSSWRSTKEVMREAYQMTKVTPLNEDFEKDSEILHFFLN